LDPEEIEAKSGRKQHEYFLLVFLNFGINLDFLKVELEHNVKAILYRRTFKMRLTAAYNLKELKEIGSKFKLLSENLFHGIF